MYVHQPATKAVRKHLTRYPRHYGALALFAISMVLVPTIGGVDVLQPISDAGSLPSASAEPATTSTGGSATAPASGTVAHRSAPPAAGRAPLAGSLGATSAAADRTNDGVPAPQPPSEDEPGSPPPPDGGDAGGGLGDLPSPPPVPVPDVPPELQPVIDAVAPLTTQGCSTIGLAAVVLAVAAPTAGDAVPVAEVMPYLAPAYSACATFPAPDGSATICALDEAAQAAGYPADVAGLMNTPNVVGIGVDTLRGVEAAVEAYTGMRWGLVDGIAEGLGCH